MTKPKRGHPKGIASPGSGRTPVRPDGERITITIAGETLAKLDREASVEGISRAELVRRLLEAACA